MRFMRYIYYSLLAVAIFVPWVLLNGCAPTSAGPSQPLLPQLTAEEKFSDRFELEEEPQFFYDLFGRELLEGNEVHQYVETKQFDASGNLVAGWTGQLDSVRFSSQLDRTILTEDTYRGRHTEFAIGDHLTIKDNTLWPMAYIMRKTEFDGSDGIYPFLRISIFSALSTLVYRTRSTRRKLQQQEVCPLLLDVRMLMSSSRTNSSEAQERSGCLAIFFDSVSPM